MASRVLSGLYAGITTPTRLPLIIGLCAGICAKYALMGVLETTNYRRFEQPFLIGRENREFCRECCRDGHDETGLKNFDMYF